MCETVLARERTRNLSTGNRLHKPLYHSATYPYILIPPRLSDEWANTASDSDESSTSCTAELSKTESCGKADETLAADANYE